LKYGSWIFIARGENFEIGILKIHSIYILKVSNDGNELKIEEFDNLLGKKKIC
jgi:hypothetical protein